MVRFTLCGVDVSRTRRQGVFGIPAADRGPVGIRLPGGHQDGHGLRRQAEQQAGELPGKPYNGAEAGPSLKRAAKVGSYPPNARGLHDMHGNVFEWCRDWSHPKVPGGTDPDLYGKKARPRVRRGGCWADEGWPCRSAFRLRFEPERRSDHIGFRVVAVQPWRLGG